MIGLIGSCIFFILLSHTVYADEAVITSDNLNIRNGPGTDFDIIGRADTNDIFPIITVKDDWVQIELEDEPGWVTKEYITIENTPTAPAATSKTNEEDPADTEVTKSVTIQFDNTQLREGPSTDYDIIRFVGVGSKFDVVSENESWYKISKNDFTGYVSKQLVEKDSTSTSTGIKHKTIIIDAGHGGRDVGAIGATGVFEKDITYLTARELERELTMLGANVLLTRSEDEFISLSSRTSFSNIKDTDAFISIHYNSVPELPAVTGIESYFYHEHNKNLAKYIQQEIIKETGAIDRGITQGNFAVIRQNFKPSILVELGFISNEEKEALLGTSIYQQKLVSGIVNGLRRYFSND